ncbi:hypothetical protein GHT06_018559 [Daphnia sinensis]|uniref:Uncharacterized protein n=1 Tax=Daphnia sinensis TaxID=1820382 RepID=A0AAD5L4E5_9CRUS|nr:hypothetical protein GHT06_018559 [Daphnia sinensis]
MLMLDSTAQLPRALPMVNHPASQAAAQALSKSWGSHGIMAEDTTSGASNVSVRLPIHTVSTSFGVLGSGSLRLKRNNVVGRPVKTDLSRTQRVMTQRKNSSVKFKQLSTGAMASVFGGPVKGLKKALEEVSTLSQLPTRESTSADTPLGSTNKTSLGPCPVGGNTSSSHLLATSLQPFSIKKPRLARHVDASQSFRSELQEELMAVGYAEEPDLLVIVEPCGYFYCDLNLKRG